MGALYEDVEKFFGDVFAQYGRWVARYPLVFMLLSLVACALLGTGLVSMRYEQRVLHLYTPADSPALRDQRHLAALFTGHGEPNTFYRHQLLRQAAYGQVIVRMRDTDENEDVLQAEVLRELWDLYEALTSVNALGFGFPELCARRDGACVVDGLPLLKRLRHSPDPCLPPPANSSEGPGTPAAELRGVLGGISLDNHCISARAFKLRFNLAPDYNGDSVEGARDRALRAWEQQFLARVREHKTQHLEVEYAASSSLDLELAADLALDIKYFALTIVIMVLYASFVTSGGDWVSTRMLLAHAGVLAALLAILASFGLLSMCGLVFVDICGVMPFLVLGIGLDDMFIILSGWRRTDLRHSVEERISETFRTSAISVTITSLTDLLAFSIGATSPFLSVKNFCVFAGVAVLFCYVNQLMFFGGCLVLHARRVRASRHCLTCRVIGTREAMRTDGRLYSKAEVFCCTGRPPQDRGAEDSLCEKIPGTILPKLLMKAPTKALVIGLFIIYLVVSIWGASQLKTGLRLEDMVPDTSYLARFLRLDRTYFGEQGPPVMLAVTEPTSYDDSKLQQKVQRVLTQAAASPYVYPEPVSWLQAYTDFLRNTSRNPDTPDFLQILQTEFLPQHPEYTADVRFSEKGDSIVASRFYLNTHPLNSSEQEGQLMRGLRLVAANCSLPMTAFSPQFVFFEHSESILKNTLLAVGVSIIGMLFIALMFIPHPISISCVTATMLTIVLGMLGCMKFWSLELSAITKLQLILSVGFCVDFTVHISHAFMTATGKNRNERVLAALEKAGIPILNGGLSSVLGVLMLAFASSYIFKCFFKTMLLVMLLGLAHALLLLPVLLSFIGPRRTARTVFVPVHHTARSIMCDSSPAAARRNPDTERCSSPSTREEDLSDTEPRADPREELELIQMDCEGDGGPQRKVLTPVFEEGFELAAPRFRVTAQDSVDTESFQSLDVMN